jgi:copper(I)-binding protein
VTARRSLGALALVALAATACSAGRHTETDKERATPYLASAAVGDVTVHAVRVVVADDVSSATAPQAYLTAAILNSGTQPDSLTNATVSGSGAAPVGTTTPDFTLPPRQIVQIGDPDLGFTGTALGIGALQEPLVPGTTTTVTFTFQSAGTVTVVAPVITSSGMGTTASAAPINTVG